MIQNRNLEVGRLILGIVMMAVGVLHFTHVQLFTSIVPDYLPAPQFLVYLSGVIEIGLGIGLLIERTRVPAAWALIALYVAVFPANINMALHPDMPLGGVDVSIPPILLWLRLPLQLALIYWAWLYTRPRPAPLTATARA